MAYGDKYPTSAPMAQQYDKQAQLPMVNQTSNCVGSKEPSVIDKIADIYQQLNNIQRTQENLHSNLNRVLSIIGIEWI